jgi:hypothetical protein
MKMFDFLGIFVPLFFIFVFSLLIFNIVKGIKEWSNNNKQPVLSVAAKIVSKRSHTSNSTSVHDGHHHHHTSSTYYVTFQVESGDRMEFRVSGKEYGLLAEGDIGKLTFQGTRYHGFEIK